MPGINGFTMWILYLNYITGFYRVEVSGKVPVSPSAFQLTDSLSKSNKLLILNYRDYEYDKVHRCVTTDELQIIAPN